MGFIGYICPRPTLTLLYVALVVISKILDVPIISNDGQDWIFLKGSLHQVWEYRPRPVLPPRLVVSIENEYMGRICAS